MDALLGAGPRRARGGLGTAPPEPGHAAAPPPWARFSAWLECVCVVTFDLELGQALELVYPSDSRLTDKEKSSICYLSFPDSHSGGLGDTQFSFRIRQSGGQRGPWPAEDQLYNRAAPESLQRESAHYFGYVYFRQVKDSSVKRGYFQKSLVLVSRLPFVRLFQALLSIIAPEYFDKLVPCLEAVCSEIDQWPAPAPGKTLNLPVMGVVVQVYVPSRADKLEASALKPCSLEKLLPAPMVLASIHEPDLFRCFQPVLMHVQMLWELVLLGEPLVVLAPSPAVSSEIVLALTSLLQPLRFCSDYRPYFTVHDSEFKELMTRTRAPTGPTFSEWGSPECQVRLAGASPTLSHEGRWQLPGGTAALSPTWHVVGDFPKQVKLKKPSRLKTLDTKPGLYTSYSAHLSRDKALLKRLLKEHYMTSLMPLRRSVEPWKSPPQIRPFLQDDFLRSLEHAGPGLTCIIKGDWLGLYRRFFKSPHFDGWYRQRHKEMAQQLEALHLQAICEADLEAWMKDKSEVEVVDLVLKLREKLVRAQGHQLPVKEEILRLAQLYLEKVMSSLPKNLQAVLSLP
ncbi:protein DENND6B isoform X9 [Tamandua tetradactyla]|uniref:protein DENND6B isoform X9 n=1 Tax=Tamandua tetradactyla TaxID=48850 RepID=UPI004053D335